MNNIDRELLYRVARVVATIDPGHAKMINDALHPAFEQYKRERALQLAAYREMLARKNPGEEISAT